MSGEAVDPRVRTARRSDGEVVVNGLRCTACGLPTVADVERCPDCRGQVAPAQFGPRGVVSASTRLHVGVPGYEPPYVLAYVVLDDGPRVLAHVTAETAPPPGSCVVLTELLPGGDISVRPVSAETAA